jgi:hypothetical protein
MKALFQLNILRYALPMAAIINRGFRSSKQNGIS